MYFILSFHIPCLDEVRQARDPTLQSLGFSQDVVLDLLQDMGSVLVLELLQHGEHLEAIHGHFVGLVTVLLQLLDKLLDSHSIVSIVSVSIQLLKHIFTNEII